VDRERVDRLLKYALLYAGELGYGYDLGDIHLLKYIYLADLEYASRHNGETYTKAGWYFHHFGPWEPAVHAQIPRVVESLGATITAREYEEGKEYRRYRVQNPELRQKIDDALPYDLVSALQRYIKEHGNEKASLLGYVYRTPPMVNAAPGERLDFATSIAEKRRPALVEDVAVSRRQEKKLEEHRQEFKEAFNRKLQEKLAAKKARKKAENYVPPRYDETFARGTAWLDSLAGSPIPEVSGGEAVVTDAVWKSKARTDGEVP